MDEVTSETPSINLAGKRCFVIMPYGKKSMAEGYGRWQGDADSIIDFDHIYFDLIKPAVESIRLECKRSDEVSRSGIIHTEMIQDIMESDAVVVDITLLNPNVFYELGVRHTARRSGTVVIRHADQRIPFNINGLRVFEYDVSEASTKSLATTVANSLAEQAVDSLVYSLTSNSMSIQRIGRPIGWRETVKYTNPSAKGRTFCIVTGDVCLVKDIDVWVNPENTRMEMGRVNDESFSACIRYLGGKKNIQKRIVRDYIQDQLTSIIGRDADVAASHVVTTASGNLAKSNGVKAIIHTAAMHGEPTKGYQLIRSYPNCVTNVLAEMDRLNKAILLGYRFNPFRGALRSVLFPLLGTRERRIDPEDVAYNLVLAATNYMENHQNTTVETVYFLAYTDVDRALCENAFRRNEWAIAP